MNYTFEEAARELDNLFDKLIGEAKTDKEKHYLESIWKTYKQGKAKGDDEYRYENGCFYKHFL